MSYLLSFSKLAFSATTRVAPSSVTMAARGYATKKLFIGNIAYGTTDAEAHEHFQQYGTITDLYFPKDEQGRTRGYGFIEMDEVDCNKVLQEANALSFKGRTLRIQFAERFRKGKGNNNNSNNRNNNNDRPAAVRADGSGVYRPPREDGAPRENRFRKPRPPRQ
ncbi:hypothetical protein BGW42_003476 [Actinomortierella wolfii]|nr:hypothetical protein BGW42_003476 [Actinomortierella wolfii]